MKAILPDPFGGESEYRRFWHLDLRGRDDLDLLQAELVLLRQAECRILLKRTERLIFCGDIQITDLGWLRGRQSAIRAHLQHITRRAS